jgi:hypothetical protein
MLAAVLAGSSLDAQRRRLPPGAALLGQVVDAQSGRGLDRVIVDLDGAGLRRRILSDDRGRFLLAGLPAGEYRINAIRAGFLNGAFGQRRPAGSASTITLVDGQWMSDIEVRLWRPGVLTGFVTDHGGVPITGVIVRAYRHERVPGRTTLREVAQAVTDDTGAYRLASLVPGNHVVGISAQHVAVTNNDTGETFATAEPEIVFPPMYFPSAESAMAASTVTAESGRDFTGINFSLPTLPVLEVSGRVDPATVPDGQMRAVRLFLARPLDPFVAESPTHRYLGAVSPDEEGHFTFAHVPSGRYEIEATLVVTPLEGPEVPDAPNRPRSPERLWDNQPVTLDQQNLDDIRVTMRPGLEVEGRTRMMSPINRAAAQPGKLLIELEPLFEAPGIRPQTLASDETGTFRTGPVLVPGRYLVRVGGVPPGWRLQAVMAGGIDVSEEGLDLSSGFVPSDLQIDLTDQLTLITGTVRGVGPFADPTATVLLFPQQDRSGSMAARRFRSVRTGRDGTFSLRNIPAGAYLIAAVDDAEADGWQDPDRLTTLRRSATPVSIREGEAKVLELRRIGVR